MYIIDSKIEMKEIQQFYTHIYYQEKNKHIINQIVEFKQKFKDIEGLSDICDELIDGLLGYDTILSLDVLLDGFIDIIKSMRS